MIPNTNQLEKNPPIEKSSNLSDLVSGDWVIFQRNRNDYMILPIDRTTNTLIIVKIPNYANEYHDWKFYKKDGNEVGMATAYYAPNIRPFSIELLNRLKQYDRYKKVFERMPFVPEHSEQLINECYEFLLSKGFISPIS